MFESKAAKKWLGIVVVMQGLILLVLLGGTPSATPAMAQIPDAGAQRDQIIDQLKSQNEKLDKLLALLSGGDLQVKVAKPDDSKGHD
jgi:hypothetical protein